MRKITKACVSDDSRYMIVSTAPGVVRGDGELEDQWVVWITLDGPCGAHRWTIDQLFEGYVTGQPAE